MSFAKNYINGKWYEFNDSWVSEGNYNSVAILPKLSNNNYFYIFVESTGCKF